MLVESLSSLCDFVYIFEAFLIEVHMQGLKPIALMTDYKSKLNQKTLLLCR